MKKWRTPKETIIFQLTSTTCLFANAWNSNIRWYRTVVPRRFDALGPAIFAESFVGMVWISTTTREKEGLKLGWSYPIRLYFFVLAGIILPRNTVVGSFPRRKMILFKRCIKRFQKHTARAAIEHRSDGICQGNSFLFTNGGKELKNDIGARLFATKFRQINTNTLHIAFVRWHSAKSQQVLQTPKDIKCLFLQIGLVKYKYTSIYTYLTIFATGWFFLHFWHFLANQKNTSKKTPHLVKTSRCRGRPTVLEQVGLDTMCWNRQLRSQAGILQFEHLKLTANVLVGLENPGFPEKKTDSWEVWKFRKWKAHEILEVMLETREG